MPTDSYQEFVLESLNDPKEAAEYLTACYEDSEEIFLLGLHNVIEAYGGMAKLSSETTFNRENIDKLLSECGNPTLSSFRSILSTLGLQLVFLPQLQDSETA